jgi:hypothetical protein
MACPSERAISAAITAIFHRLEHYSSIFSASSPAHIGFDFKMS